MDSRNREQRECSAPQNAQTQHSATRANLKPPCLGKELAHARSICFDVPVKRTELIANPGALQRIYDRIEQTFASQVRKSAFGLAADIATTPGSVPGTDPYVLIHLESVCPGLVEIFGLVVYVFFFV